MPKEICPRRESKEVLSKFWFPTEIVQKVSQSSTNRHGQVNKRNPNSVIKTVGVQSHEYWKFLTAILNCRCKVARPIGRKFNICSLMAWKKVLVLSEPRFAKGDLPECSQFSVSPALCQRSEFASQTMKVQDTSIKQWTITEIWFYCLQQDSEYLGLFTWRAMHKHVTCIRL